MYPIGLESSTKVSPLDQPTRPQTTHTSDISLTNPSIETISDDDASNLFILKDLKPLATSNLENRQDQSAQETTNIKQQIPREDESNIEKEQNVCHTPIDLDSGDNNSDQRRPHHLSS